MSTYTWEYGAAESGLHFDIVYNDTDGTFTVTVKEGAFDLNALWFSDGVSGNTDAVDVTLSKKENSLNMNGTGIEWDDYAKISDTGLGNEGTSKESYLSADGNTSMTFTLEDLGLTADSFEWESMILGVRATSVSGGDSDSFKLVDAEPVVVNDEANYFTFEFGDDPLNIVANSEDYVDNTAEDGFNAAAGASGNSGDDLNYSTTAPTSFNDNIVTADSGEDGDPGGDGLNAYEITNTLPYDGIKIISNGTGPNSILGGAGGAGGSGGDGGSIIVDSGRNANENTLTGGDGGDGGGGGDGGHAIVNGNLNVVIIEGDQDLIILGGNGGVGGDGGDGGDVIVEADNNVNNNILTSGDGGDGGDGGAGGDGSVGGDGGDGGTVTADGDNQNNGNTIVNGGEGDDGLSTGLIAAFSDRVDVDASAFTGHLTISGSDDDDTMVMGSGGSLIYDTLGSDAYTLGDGVDIVHYVAMEPTVTDEIINFDTTEDVLDISDLLVGYDGNYGLFVDLTEDNGNTIVSVDTDGGGDSFQELVVLQGHTGLDLNTLVTNGTIDVI